MGRARESLEHKASGEATWYLGDYKGAVYVSGIFHHVRIDGLQAETVYYYR